MYHPCANTTGVGDDGVFRNAPFLCPILVHMHLSCAHLLCTCAIAWQPCRVWVWVCVCRLCKPPNPSGGTYRCAVLADDDLLHVHAGRVDAGSVVAGC